MSKNPKIGIWGPTVAQSDSFIKDTSNALPYTSIPKHRRITWGIKDVVWGFVLLLASQVVIAAIIVGREILKVMDDGNIRPDIDADSILESAAAAAYDGPILLASALLMYLSWFAVIRRASKSKGLGSYARDFWLKFNWKKDIMIGISVAVILRLAEQGVTWLLPALGVDLTGAGNTDPIISQQGIWYILNAIIIASFAAPFFEEFFFRGLFLQSLRRFFDRRRLNHDGKKTFLSKNSKWIAVVISSLAFGSMHYQGTETFGQWFVMIQTGIIGMMLALLVFKTKRLGTSICAHVFFNLSGVILATVLQ